MSDYVGRHRRPDAVDEAFDRLLVDQWRSALNEQRVRVIDPCSIRWSDASGVWHECTLPCLPGVVTPHVCGCGDTFG